MMFPTIREFLSEYQMPLAHALNYIERRGILVSRPRLSALAKHVDEQQELYRMAIEKIVNHPVTVYKDTKNKNAWCLNSNKDLKVMFQELGLSIPKKRVAGPNGSYKMAESLDETALQRIFGETNNPVTKALLTLRELGKIKGTYINATLFNDTLYCSYVPIGTVGGRRSSRASVLDIGTNQQNLPKHSKLGMKYRECLVPRPGKVFLACDQKGAEDWIVTGLIADNGGSEQGLNELRQGINRHKRLASFLFSKPESECGKDSGDPPGILYLLGKKTRHAGNYGMRENKFSEELAKEGHSVSPAACKNLLKRFHTVEPDIQGVFQKYVEHELNTKHTLTTPIGRSRQFLSLRSFTDNSSIYRDAYSYIPQSTVGDNTGLAILQCETNHPGLVISDAHDAIYLEVDDTYDAILEGVSILRTCFNRDIVFDHGCSINIPVEFELGYSLGTMISFDYEDQVRKAVERAKESNSLVDKVH